MSDFRNSYIFPTEKLSKDFSLEMREKVNTGIFSMDPRKYFLLDIFEMFLEKAYMHNLFWDYFVEQTALALIFSQFRKDFIRLSKKHQISNDPITQETICHHFVSNYSRPKYFTKGLQRLSEQSLLDLIGH